MELKLTRETETMLKSAVVGILSGVAAGVIADRIAMGAKRRGKEREVAEYHAVVDDLGYSDPEAELRVSPAFEKPDISTMVDYTKFSKHSKDEGEGEKDGKGQDTQAQPSPVAIISQEEFLRATGNEDGFVSVVGTWFPEDKILAGWNEELEPKDVEANVGWDVMAAFDDPGVGAVYARNHELKVLYEIVRGSGTYEDSAAEG